MRRPVPSSHSFIVNPVPHEGPGVVAAETSDSRPSGDLVRRDGLGPEGPRDDSMAREEVGQAVTWPWKEPRELLCAQLASRSSVAIVADPLRRDGGHGRPALYLRELWRSTAPAVPGTDAESGRLVAGGIALRLGRDCRNYAEATIRSRRRRPSRSTRAQFGPSDEVDDR
jgi:hypothetical protein